MKTEKSLTLVTRRLLDISLSSGSFAPGRFGQTYSVNRREEKNKPICDSRLHNTTTKILDYNVIVVYRYLNFTREHQSN